MLTRNLEEHEAFTAFLTRVSGSCLLVDQSSYLRCGEASPLHSETRSYDGQENKGPVSLFVKTW